MLEELQLQPHRLPVPVPLSLRAGGVAVQESLDPLDQPAEGQVRVGLGPLRVVVGRVALRDDAGAEVTVEAYARRDGGGQLGQGAAEGVGEQEISVRPRRPEGGHMVEIDAEPLRRSPVQLQLLEHPALEVVPVAAALGVRRAVDTRRVGAGVHLQEEGVLRDEQGVALRRQRAVREPPDEGVVQTGVG